MRYGKAKSDVRVYVAIEMNRTLHLKIDGEEIEVELESLEDGRAMKEFVQEGI